mmetsp:Transcript_18693/g.26327  ORF Transcript_18693/g.26327 Transcript_18693/m.26327 type:complete len:281 (+) Transcript_18693:724-1566(+)
MDVRFHPLHVERFTQKTISIVIYPGMVLPLTFKHTLTKTIISQQMMIQMPMKVQPVLQSLLSTNPRELSPHHHLHHHHLLLPQHPLQMITQYPPLPHLPYPKHPPHPQQLPMNPHHHSHTHPNVTTTNKLKPHPTFPFAIESMPFTMNWENPSTIPIIFPPTTANNHILPNSSTVIPLSASPRKYVAFPLSSMDPSTKEYSTYGTLTKLSLPNINSQYGNDTVATIVRHPQDWMHHPKIMIFTEKKEEHHNLTPTTTTTAMKRNHHHHPNPILEKMEDSW